MKTTLIAFFILISTVKCSERQQTSQSSQPRQIHYQNFEPQYQRNSKSHKFQTTQSSPCTGITNENLKENSKKYSSKSYHKCDTSSDSDCGLPYQVCCCYCYFPWNQQCSQYSHCSPQCCQCQPWFCPSCCCMSSNYPSYHHHPHCKHHCYYSMCKNYCRPYSHCSCYSCNENSPNSCYNNPHY